MTELIERYFDIAIKSPDGIKKLRELILTLAMQGKLVPQDTNDLPASELLKQIEVEKKRLIKEGKIKKQEPLPPIKPEEEPYALPAGWQWVRLGDVCKQITDGEHQTPPRIPEGRRLLSAKNIRDGFIDYSNHDCISDRDYIKSRKRCCPEYGDLLIVSVGGTIGRNALVLEDDDFALVRSVALIKPSIINPKFLRHVMNSVLLQSVINEKKRGGAQPCLYLSEIAKFLVPLPPLAEQKRIVAKVDELMALCDKLETERDARTEKRLAVQKAAVEQLMTAADKVGFDLAWEFITRNFADLYSVPENVADLKKAILQLAVMGKLVPQDPSDPPASELLKEIAAEKKKLIKEGKIKKQEPMPPIKPEEVPCEVPAGWEWVRLVDLGRFLGGKTPSTNRTSYWQGTIPWVSAKDMKSLFIHDSEDHVTEEGVASGLAMIPIHSILMVVRSGILRRTFPVAINSTVCTINQDLKALVLFPGVYAEYVLLMLRGFEKYILSNLTKAGMTVESVVFNEFCSHSFPLPPLAEQKRIVAKVDELMALCDALEQHLKDATSKQTDILNAVVAGM